MFQGFRPEIQTLTGGLVPTQFKYGEMRSLTVAVEAGTEPDRAALGVSAMPRSGGADFALRCVNGPPSAAALVGVSATCLPVAVSVGGLDLWLAVPGLVLAPVFADPYGTIVVPAPIPASVPPGASACVQLFLVDPCGPGGWSATSALKVTIQP